MSCMDRILILNHSLNNSEIFVQSFCRDFKLDCIILAFIVSAMASLLFLKAIEMLLHCKLITFVVSLTSTFLLVPFNKAFNLTMWPTLSQSFKQTAQLFESGHFHDGVEIKASVSSVRKFIYSDIVIAHKSIHY